MTNPVSDLVRQFFDFHTGNDERLYRAENHITKLERKMASVHELLQTLNDKVSAQNSVIESTQTTLATLSSALKEAQSQIASSGDVSLLNDIISGVDQHTASLSQAIAANTPAASDPVPTTPADPVTTDTPLSSSGANNTGTSTDAPASTGETASTDAPAPTTTETSAPTTTDAPAPATDGNNPSA